MASALRFIVRPESFCIHRLPPGAALDPGRLSGASWYSVTRTGDELSIVAPTGYDLGPGDREAGWSCLQIAGVLDFGMVGVIAGVSKVLADANVAIFTISTYNTDYFLVKTSDFDRAIGALIAAGHVVTRDTGSGPRPAPG